MRRTFVGRQHFSRMATLTKTELQLEMLTKLLHSTLSSLYSGSRTTEKKKINFFKPLMVVAG